MKKLLIIGLVLLTGCAQTQEERINCLIKQLTIDDWEVRNSALRSLKEIGKPAVEPLINKLHDKDEKTQIMAATALGIIGDKSVLKALDDASKNRDPKKDGFAMTLLVVKYQIAKKFEIKSLKETLLTGKDEKARSEAAKILGEIDEPSAVRPLIEALKDKSDHVRAQAVGALGKLTNQDFGEDYDKWLDWWEKNKFEDK